MKHRANKHKRNMLSPSARRSALNQSTIARDLKRLICSVIVMALTVLRTTNPDSFAAQFKARNCPLSYKSKSFLNGLRHLKSKAF